MPRGGTAGGSKKSSNIQFQRPSEPSFLKRIKEQVGYKETVTIESKRSLLNQDNHDDDREDRDDEQPAIVVLKEGDLTAEQVQAEKDKSSLDENGIAPSDGRILFKKPSSSKKREKDSNSPEPVKESKEKKKKKEKKTEKSLLSFEELDDE